MDEEHAKTHPTKKNVSKAAELFFEKKNRA